MACEKVKKEIALEREHECTGCYSRKHLSHSHYVRVSKRKDLECEKEVITYHCLSVGKEGCHQIWESCEYEKMSKLADFKHGMAMVKKYDKQFYQFLLMRFEQQGYKFNENDF